MQKLSSRIIFQVWIQYVNSHFMKAQIKYTELEEIISSKTGQDITFRHSAAEGMDGDSINVGYVFTKTLPIIGQVRKELAATLKLVGIEGPVVKLRLTDKQALAFIGGTVLSALKDRGKVDFITSTPDGTFAVDFSKIDKTREVFNYVDVRQLIFDDDQIMAEVKIN